MLWSFTLAACNRSPNPGQPEARIYQRAQLLMGTVVQIKLVATDADAARRALDAAMGEIERVSLEFDHRLVNSPAAQVNRAAGGAEVSVPAEFAHLVQRGRMFSTLTGGKFDMTIGPVTGLWNFDSAPQIPPDPLKNKELLKLVDYRKLDVREDPPLIKLAEPGMALDFGAIAQGYAADRAFIVLNKLGINSMVIDASGDLRVAGTKPDGQPWLIGIQHPRQPDKLIAMVELKKGALVTSGDYERCFVHEGRRYHHILDPQTGYPAEGCQSVSIWAPDAVTADALATGVFAMGPEAGMRLVERVPGTEALIIARDGSKLVSSGLKNKLQFVP